MIDKVIIHDFEEQFAPPENNVLEVCVVDGVVFLSISKYEETHDTTKTRRLAQVAVNVDELADTLLLLDDRVDKGCC